LQIALVGKLHLLANSEIYLLPVPVSVRLPYNTGVSDITNGGSLTILERPPITLPALPVINDEADLVRQAQYEQIHRLPNDAFAELYRRYLTRVYRFSLIRTGSVPDAQDITAQTFLTALKGLKNYRGENFGAWLFGIARHKLADHYRRRPAQVSLDSITEIEILASELSLDETVSGRLTLERVNTALLAIASDRAEALSLHIFGGLSMAEIGVIMGRSESAVKMLAHRALTDLRQRLEHLKGD
jgi:RNA polymerase sigma-70 factor (ECF subfamily)